ncbi:MAG: YqgE/AlgH family protein [Salibacteraceae bacterium]
MSDSNKQKAFDNFFRGLDFHINDVSEGKILISEPFLEDPNFSRSVVFLVKHSIEDGSFGFVINQVSEFTINDALEDFPEFDAPIAIGGPVGNQSLFFLHTRNDIISGGTEVSKGLFWGGDFKDVKMAAELGAISKKEILFFIGYSGWEAGQLEIELKDKSWIVTDITTEEIMNMDRSSLWDNKLQTMGKNFKLLSTFTADPSMN